MWGPGRVAEVRSKAEVVSRLREAPEAGPELGCVPRVAGSPGRCWSGMVPPAGLSRVMALAPECGGGGMEVGREEAGGGACRFRSVRKGGGRRASWGGWRGHRAEGLRRAAWAELQGSALGGEGPQAGFRARLEPDQVYPWRWSLPRV